MIDLSNFQNFNIKLWHTYTFQAIAAGLQIANILTDVVPTEWKPGIAAFIGFCQWLQANFGHLHNVDGTPQSQPGPVVPQATAPPKVEGGG